MNQHSIKIKTVSLLGISEEQYHQAVFELGIDFLEHATHDDWSVTTISHTKQFWAWWRNQFAIADEVFCAQYPTVSAHQRKHLQKAWLRRHSPDHVHAHMTPDVLNAAGIVFDQLTSADRVEGVEL